MKKVRVGSVSYLNARPLIYGIRNHPVFEQMELVEDYPARIAAMLVNDELDMGLIPVAATLKMKEWHIAGDHCIGSVGPVASVCIFSEVPIEEVKEVYLDYQSRTSVNLARVLLKEFWNLDVEFRDAGGEDFRKQISGTTAGVVIGDRALEQRTVNRYVYDLGEAWKLHTGLPFVFAAWISNKPMAPEFIAAFNEANALGMEMIDEVIRENPFPAFDLDLYFRHFISYPLDDEKKQGMDLFLEKLRGGV